MKTIVISIIIAGLLIAGAVMLSRNGNNSTLVARGNNVTVVDGKQIIEIHAKAGYKPRKSVAQAGIPTVLRFYTNGTFDCSASVRIPSMNISKTLSQTGYTDIEIGVQKVATLQGTCGMGMYPFGVEFKRVL